MNDQELESLLRMTSVSEDSDDIKIDLLKQLTQSHSGQIPIYKYRRWRRVALAGWVVAGIAISSATLLPRSSKPDPISIDRNRSVVAIETLDGGDQKPGSESTTLSFESDSNEPLHQIRHPWSSTVIMLTTLPTDLQQKTLPIGAVIEAPIDANETPSG